MDALFKVSAPLLVLILTPAFFLMVLVRYFLVAGSFYSYYHISKAKTRINRIVDKTYNYKQIRQEIKWAIYSSVIFAIVGVAAMMMYHEGSLKIYTGLHDYGLWYIPVSIILAMIIQETYYYFIHRWMHRPHIYKIMHYVHHASLTPSPWGAFAFHPLEAFLMAGILPIILIIVPMHYYAFLAYLIVMTFSSVINHLNIEIYPKWFRESKLGPWFIGASHHTVHHTEFRKNYGLYFTFWDRWLGTEKSEK